MEPYVFILKNRIIQHISYISKYNTRGIIVLSAKSPKQAVLALKRKFHNPEYYEYRLKYIPFEDYTVLTVKEYELKYSKITK